MHKHTFGQPSTISLNICKSYDGAQIKTSVYHCTPINYCNFDINGPKSCWLYISIIQIANENIDPFTPSSTLTTLTPRFSCKLDLVIAASELNVKYLFESFWKSFVPYLFGLFSLNWVRNDFRFNKENCIPIYCITQHDWCFY